MKKIIPVLTLALLFVLSACDISSVEYLLYSEDVNQTLYVGQTSNLDLITKKNNVDQILDYTIVSENQSIVTVTNKTVNAVAVGVTKVTATLKDDINVSIEINITVIPSIEFTNLPSSQEIEVEETILLNVIDRSDINQLGVTWTSSSTNVATVSAGLVLAVASGNTTIRATSNTSNHYVEVVITVKEVQVVNTYEIIPSTTLLSMYEDQEVTPIFLTKVNGVITNLPYTLSVDDASMAVIEGNKVIALKDGTITLTATLVDQPLISTSVTITVGKSLEIENLQDTYTMYVNDTLALAVIDRSDISQQGVRWNVNHLTRATVDQGTVLSKLAGVITVTATSNTSGRIVSVQITIIERVIDDVSLDLPEDEIDVESSFQLLSQVYPLNATQGLTYTSSNESVVTVDANGVVKTFRSGNVTITARSIVDPTKVFAIQFNVTVDPMGLFERFHVETPIRQYVTTFGYNPSQRFQWVNGSVTQYFFDELNLKQMIIPVNTNAYVGQQATPQILQIVEPLNRTRSGILHDETKYIIYHDTGNHNPGATAYMHANYIQSADNANNRARSWHFTVDENEIYQHLPTNEVAWQGDSYLAYAKGIGIETAVNFGADLYTTWHRTGKLIASLMVQYNLGMDSILQHYDTSGKNCPQALRMSGLYDDAIELAKAEYIVARDLSQYNIKFTSLSPDYVDNRGRVISAPATATRVAYQIEITGPSYSESKIFYSVLPGVDGTTSVTLIGTAEDVQAATEFDLQVASLPKVITLQVATMINEIRALYQLLTPIQQTLAVGEKLLAQKEVQLHQLYALNTPVVINQILMTDNSILNNGYIELYNATSQDINLAGYTLQYANAGQPFSTISGDEYLKWYAFSDNDIIKAKGYFLIQVSGSGDITDAYLPLPDAITSFSVQPNGKIVLSKTADAITSAIDINIADLVGFGSASMTEGGGAANVLVPEQALIRRQQIDTDLNVRDFLYTVANPRNTKNHVINPNLTFDQLAAMQVDLLIIGLPSTLTIDDETQVAFAREQYQILTTTQKGLVQSLSRLNAKEIEIEGLMSEDLRMINQAIAALPYRIVKDFTLPTNGGVSWAYKDGEDSSYFNITSGIYLQLSLQAQLRTLIVSLNSESKEVVVNFGVAEPSNLLVYNTGGLAPSAGGRTADGVGTYAEQFSRVGFGGYSITVGSKVYFIGSSAYIPLSTPQFAQVLTREELRPLGGVNFVNNIGLVNGTPTEYRGTGVLYHNTTTQDLMFDPSDTYGRNNSAVYGYYKVVFSPNSGGTYTVKTGWADSGQNETTLGRMETLKPGEFLWCPHTYETNQSVNGGTWLIQPGDFTVGGVLTPGTIINIQQFKINY